MPRRDWNFSGPADVLVPRIRGAYGRQSCTRPTLCSFHAAFSASKTRLSCRSMVPLVQSFLAESQLRSPIKILGSTFPLLPSLSSHPCHPSLSVYLPPIVPGFSSPPHLFSPPPERPLPFLFPKPGYHAWIFAPSFPLNPSSQGPHSLPPQVGSKHLRSRPMYPVRTSSHPCHPSFPVSFSTYRSRLSLFTPICPSPPVCFLPSSFPKP